MRVGLLLPNSNIIHRLASDIRGGVSNGLDDGGCLDHDLVIETTAYNDSVAQVCEKIQKLVISDDVAIVVAPLNPVMALEVGGLTAGQLTPLLMLTMGEDTFAGDLAPPWVFVNSFGLWRSAWLAGFWAVSTYGPSACNIAAAHEGGYGCTLAFALGVEAAGGSLVATLPASLQLDDAEADRIWATTRELDVDVIMLSASGEDLNILGRTMTRLGGTIPTIGLPPHEYGGGTQRTRAEALFDHSISSWDPSTSESRAFINRFVTETGRPAHTYALLAYEAGRLVASATEGLSGEPRGEALRRGLSSAGYRGPRGSIAFSADGQEVVADQHLLQMFADDDGAGAAGEIFDAPALLDQQVELARLNLDKTGWLNPYLIA